MEENQGHSHASQGGHRQYQIIGIASSRPVVTLYRTVTVTLYIAIVSLTRRDATRRVDVVSCHMAWHVGMGGGAGGNKYNCEILN